MMRAMIREFVAAFTLGLVLILMLATLFLVGCDENDPYFPDVEVTVTASPGADPHGTIRVSPSPLPPFEVQFKDEPSPTPVAP